MDNEDTKNNQGRDHFHELELKNTHLQTALKTITERANLIEKQLVDVQKHLENKIQERTCELAQKNIELSHSKEIAEQARIAAEMATRAKSTFLANMSHELHTPLNAIMGYGELLIEDLVEHGHSHWANDLKKILSAARHLLGLIDDILDISKIEAGKVNVYLETFDIQSLIQNVMSTVYPLIQQKNNRFKLQVFESLGTIHTDLIKIKQILFNLLGNAAKFTENGNIILSVKRETKNGSSWVTFTVMDEGIGISKEHIKYLFQPFEQVDNSTTRKYGGTGLGLAISKAFVDMLGGNIYVTSEIQKGSVFVVSLPDLRTEKQKE
jgi:signal transduction histidine kinase